MKKNLFTLLMVFGCISLFSACSSSDKDEVKIDSPIVGRWELNGQVDKDELIESPVFLVWEKKDNVAEKDFILNIGMNLPIPTVASMGEAVAGAQLMNLLKSVMFDESGNITAIYKDIEGDKWLTSPKGLASYTISNSVLKLSLNADKIISEAGITDQAIQKTLKDYLSEPYLIKYRLDGDDLACYIDLEFVTKNLDSLLETIDSLTDEQYDSIGGKDFIQNIAKQLPNLFEKTKKFEFGIKFKR